MPVIDLHKELRLISEELEKVRLMELGSNDKSRFKDRRTELEKKFLDIRLLIADADIERIKFHKADLVRAFNEKYPHFKEPEAGHATT